MTGQAAQRPRDLIAKGLAAFGIEGSEETVSLLASYIDELERWGRTMNLVGLKEGGRIVEGLLYDAFFIRSRLPGAGSLLDLGSGSGVVAIPLAVLDPGRDIYSVDKTFKKVLFQRHIKRLLGLKGLQVVHGRAEDISPLSTDLLVAKAFGPAAEVLDKGGRHLVGGGRAFLVRGKDEKPTDHAGFTLEKDEIYSLPGHSPAYRLFVYKKVP